ncbi:hypothetical protein LCGC14_1128580 [marine sediment metagenome]|uniref:Uncharacterized protein n=1 Tax=marine sediment metagenome TaxID=412755 RepID=A0A0F9PK23_9ZZZZ
MPVKGRVNQNRVLSGTPLKREVAMHFKKELEVTLAVCESKLKQELDKKNDLTADSLQRMQTLIILKNAAEQKLQKGEYID